MTAGEYEDSQFWFRDGVHWPEVVTPWDATIYEYAIASLSQYNTRHYIIPPALGVDFRILNGYTYLTPVGVTNPAEIEARVPHFLERAGYYFVNWDRLYDAWLVKVRALVQEIQRSPLRRCRAGADRGDHGPAWAPGPATRCRSPTTGCATSRSSCGSTISSS